MSHKTKTTYGGKREGAGRPRLPDEVKRKPVTFFISDDEKIKLKEYLQTLRNKPARD